MVLRVVLPMLTGVVLAVALVGCGTGERASVISIDGSSTVFPVSAVIAELYQSQYSDAAIEVRYSGTGGGLKKFCRGELDISNASRPISTRELEEAKKHQIQFLELPVCFDALTVVIHPDNTWAEKMTVEQLRAIWSPESEENQIRRWSDINPDWPEKEFILFGPGTDSGTFDYFTEAINGKGGRSRKDFTASEDDNVLVAGVRGNLTAIGYFGFAFYETNRDKLKAVAVRDKDKSEYVLPSQEAILKGTYTPLSRPLFIYVNYNALQRKAELQRFVDFYLNNVSQACEIVKYVPLPESAYKLVRQRFAEQRTGTAFGGHPAVGTSIDDILKRELK